MSNFNSAVSNTPKSTNFKRIIPWDSDLGDFVYGAVQDDCFKRRYNRKSLKMKIDREMDPDDWDPVSTYNTCFLVTLILILFTLIVTGVLIFIFFDNFKQFWFWWLLGFVVLLITFIVVLCIFRSSSNSKSNRRSSKLEEICTYLNGKYLKGIGTGVFPGQSGAWLEVDLDPRRTTIEGRVQKDEGEGINQKKITEKNQSDKKTGDRSRTYKDKNGEINESFQELKGGNVEMKTGNDRKDHKLGNEAKDKDDKEKNRDSNTSKNQLDSKMRTRKAKSAKVATIR